LIVCFLFARSAHAFLDPPYLTPEHPIAGDVVKVNIYGGDCDGIVGIEGWPHITRQGDAIRIDLWSTSNTDPLLCNIGVGTATYAIGAYQAGSYIVQIDREFMGDLGGIRTETLGIIPFTVTGSFAQAAPLPSLQGWGLGVLGFALFVVALSTMRRRSLAVLVFAIASGASSPKLQAQFAMPSTAPANHIVELLVTTAPGAPTPEQIVDYFDQPRGAPPLRGLTVENPLSAEFLIAGRADGDFLRLLQEHPDSVRAKLERYLLIVYPDGADLDRAVAALRADPYVASAQEPIAMDLSSVNVLDFQIDDERAESVSSAQYGRDALNIDAAWAITGGGYALVADIDSGLYVNSPWLRQFSGSQYVGGNFVPVASLDVSGRGFKIPDNPNVDERRPVLISDSNCSPSGPAMMAPVLAGHGTHTAGLIAANGRDEWGIRGTCKNCGIAMWKVEYSACDSQGGNVKPFYNSAAVAAALANIGDIGANVTNMSFGADRIANYCASIAQGSPPVVLADTAMCLAIQHASYRDVAMVGASGNNRTFLQFPANDDRVIAAGGFQENLAIWDDSPGNATHCPFLSGQECGSNWTLTSNSPRQELMASAKSVLSTTYPGFDWNAQLKCGDHFGPGGGTGLCTGTSMSAPQISGVVGLVRSINPLVPVGRPTFVPPSEKASVRSVIASTTIESQANQPWSMRTGYGRPDAASAARKMLGGVAGGVVRNRVTPLFRLYSAGAKDYADTIWPQTAVGLMINTASSWQPVASLPTVPSYPSFPHDPADGPLAAPRASVYVMTTSISPRAEWPALAPLYLMDKTFPASRDFMLVTTVVDIQKAHTAGYNLRTIQGYVYQPCTPEPRCIPPAAQKFWRKCKAGGTDCATFIESERTAFEAAGYTAIYPSGSNPLLGYAYPAIDSDGDGLPDGFELVVGTNPSKKDSDDDGLSDAIEFPISGVAVGDPCGGIGSSGSRDCPADTLFDYGFDPV
jgi:hypothetical protein